MRLRISHLRLRLRPVHTIGGSADSARKSGVGRANNLQLLKTGLHALWGLKHSKEGEHVHMKQALATLGANISEHQN